MYAIIDIETTGGNPQRDKITEIAVILHDGKCITREFTTLIDPECRIPYHISALTGITNEMVAGSPKFFEIARELVELTHDCIFVAHNSAFDYGFIRSEFQRLGYEYKREQLCTVRLSRKIIPGHRSYSLGKLCSELGIPINGRHRAMGDATATALLFSKLLETDTLNNTRFIYNATQYGGLSNLAVNPEKIRALPEEPGVYYMYDREGQLVYIGKSRNIKTRVISHFSGKETSKSLKMKAQVADIGCETTGSELLALLKESFEIKKHQPLINRRQRRSLFRYELNTYVDEKEYICFSLEKTTQCNSSPLACFTARAEARGFLQQVIEKYNLCQKLCGLYPSEGHCFHYEIGACKGACIGKEPAEFYNLRAKKVIDNYNFGIQNMLIVDTGRNPEEKSVVKIENGKFMGYGYFTPAFLHENPSAMHECIVRYPDNREVQQIIRHYLRNNKVEKVMVY
ncbi:MAG: GIY-YIG nuclease family protein [Bacteroidales bacterium]|nr:GIY-YIG nuclease family protein [Bacteroidales bacterium]